MSTDDYRKAALFNPGSFDQDFPIPDLIGQTEILSEEHRYVIYFDFRSSTFFMTVICQLTGKNYVAIYRHEQKAMHGP